MAGSFFILLDDIAALTKNVAGMSKDVGVITQTAMKKTAGVLGDDLALNAEQVAGVSPKRELPVVLAVFKGSMLNKVILIPIAMLLYSYLPDVFGWLLMAGGAFLAFEGAHAVIEKFQKEDKQAREEAHTAAIKDPTVNMVEFEREKIKSAVRTDFILSAEIIAIALSTMKNYELTTRIFGLCATAIAITVIVYGLVALLIRFDDIGLALKKKANKFAQGVGHALIVSVPHIMVSLSWFGMVALFMVGGGILLHGVPSMAHAVEHIVQGWVGTGIANTSLMIIAEALCAVVIGFIIFGIEIAVRKALNKPATH